MRVDLHRALTNLEEIDFNTNQRQKIQQHQRQLRERLNVINTSAVLDYH